MVATQKIRINQPRFAAMTWNIQIFVWQQAPLPSTDMLNAQPPGTEFRFVCFSSLFCLRADQQCWRVLRAYKLPHRNTTWMIYTYVLKGKQYIYIYTDMFMIMQMFLLSLHHMALGAATCYLVFTVYLYWLEKSIWLRRPRQRNPKEAIYHHMYYPPGS